MAPTATSETSTTLPGVAFPAIYRFTVEQYQQMEKEGKFGSERVELIDGIVVRRARMKPPHIVALGRVRRQLEARLPQGWFFRQQFDVTLSTSQPIPDGAVVVGASDDDYAERHPVPDEVPLIVEVSDSTLNTDQTTKQQMYAHDRIRVYWIVNIPQRRLEVYSRPIGGKNPKYRDVRVLAETDTVTVTIGTTAVGPIAVADLLPPASPS